MDDDARRALEQAEAFERSAQESRHFRDEYALAAADLRATIAKLRDDYKALNET